MIKSSVKEEEPKLMIIPMIDIMFFFVDFLYDEYVIYG